MSKENSTERRGAEAEKRVTALDKWKEAWKKLPEAEQDSWFAQVASRASAAEIGERIVREFHIEPDYGYQPRSFRKWVRGEGRARERARELQALQNRLLTIKGEWSLDRVREEVIRWSYECSAKREAFETALQTVTAHCRTESVQLSQRRYEDSKRANEEKAMQFCLDATRDHPEAQELFKQAFAALEKATAPK